MLYQWGYKTPQKHFREKITQLFQGFEYICSYTNIFLIIYKVDWAGHIYKLEEVIQST